MARPFVSRFLQLQRSHLCHHRGLATSTSPIIRYHTQKPLPLPLPLPRTPTPSTTVRHASSQRDRDREVRDSSNDSAVNDDARFATDLEALDFYADVPAPATSVEACLADGFVLNNGARIEGGDGCVLVDGEAFRWRPWLCGGGGGGAMLNGKGQFEVPEEAWGLFKLLWPKPGTFVCSFVFLSCSGQLALPLALAALLINHSFNHRSPHHRPWPVHPSHLAADKGISRNSGNAC